MKITLHTQIHKLPLLNEQEVLDPETRPAGLAVESDWEKHGRRHIEVHEFTFPEFGATRAYPHGTCEPFIAEIGGRRWQITFELGYHDDGTPKGGSVTFEETDKPETAWTPHRSRQYSQIFGQPKFKQGEIFPHHDGRCAGLLAVVASHWGDSGNENLFLALDADNLPWGLYHEYSCC